MRPGYCPSVLYSDTLCIQCVFELLYTQPFFKNKSKQIPITYIRKYLLWLRPNCFHWSYLHYITFMDLATSVWSSTSAAMKVACVRQTDLKCFDWFSPPGVQWSEHKFSSMSWIFSTWWNHLPAAAALGVVARHQFYQHWSEAFLQSSKTRVRNSLALNHQSYTESQAKYVMFFQKHVTLILYRKALS